jgi:hypothetical protein
MLPRPRDETFATILTTTELSDRRTALSSISRIFIVLIFGSTTVMAIVVLHHVSSRRVPVHSSAEEPASVDQDTPGRSSLSRAIHKSASVAPQLAMATPLVAVEKPAPRASKPELLPELQGLSQQKIDERRRSAYTSVHLHEAKQLGLPEPYREKYVQVLRESEGRLSDLRNRLEKFEITPDDWTDEARREGRSTGERVRALFAEARVSTPESWTASTIAEMTGETASAPSASLGQGR